MGADETVKGGGRGQGPEARVVQAVVVEERPSLVFRVLVDGRHEVLAHLVGVVKRNFVRLVPGDRVEVELTPHDPTRGRITRLVERS